MDPPPFVSGVLFSVGVCVCDLLIFLHHGGGAGLRGGEHGGRAHGAQPPRGETAEQTHQQGGEQHQEQVERGGGARRLGVPLGNLGGGGGARALKQGGGGGGGGG